MKQGVPLNVEVRLNWTTVASSDDGDWYFKVNQKINRRFKSLIQGPRVYRFVVWPPSSESPEFGGNLQVYVGESKHFERRCANYKAALTKIRKVPREYTGWLDPRLADDWKEMESNPCVRIAARLLNAERDGSKVELQFLEFDEFWVNRVQIAPNRVENQSVRRLVENLAILSSDGPKTILLNQIENPDVKQLSGVLAECNSGAEGCTRRRSNRRRLRTK